MYFFPQQTPAISSISIKKQVDANEKYSQENIPGNGSIPVQYKWYCIFKKNKIEDQDIANSPEIIQHHIKKFAGKEPGNTKNTE